MATLSARPASRLLSRIVLALNHSGSVITPSSSTRTPDHDGLGLRVVVERLDSVLLAVTGLLPAAKRQLVVDDLGRVDPGITRLDPLRRLRSPIQIRRPNGRPEPVNRRVRQLERLLHVRDPPNGQRRSEDLLGGDP